MMHIYGHSIRGDTITLYVSEFILCFLAFQIATSISAGSPILGGFDEIALSALLAASVGFALSISGLYQPDNWLRTKRLLAGILVGCAIIILTTNISFYVPLSSSIYNAGWKWSIAVIAGFIATVLLTRFMLVAASRIGLLRKRIIIIDPYDEYLEEKHWIHQEKSVDVVRIGSLETEDSQPLPDLRALRPWAVIAGQPTDLPASLDSLLAPVRKRLCSEAEFAARCLRRVETRQLAADWKLADKDKFRKFDEIVRRAFDIIISLSLLIFTAPLLIIVMISIKLDSKGGIFYAQERVGANGAVFRLLKFRSMVADAEPGGIAVWADKRDARVTRVGHFLRVTRIDEIPQVLNVLRGDMAFVGPRPERPTFVKQLAEAIPHYNQRSLVKPGITGWAQVSYPYGASVEDARMKLAYDFYYIERRSLFLDLLILIATVRVVLFQEGSR